MQPPTRGLVRRPRADEPSHPAVASATLLQVHAFTKGYAIAACGLVASVLVGALDGSSGGVAMSVLAAAVGLGALAYGAHRAGRREVGEGIAVGSAAVVAFFGVALALGLGISHTIAVGYHDYNVDSSRRERRRLGAAGESTSALDAVVERAEAR